MLLGQRNGRALYGAPPMSPAREMSTPIAAAFIGPQAAPQSIVKGTNSSLPGVYQRGPAVGEVRRIAGDYEASLTGVGYRGYLEVGRSDGPPSLPTRRSEHCVSFRCRSIEWQNSPLQ